jgi:nanoRNase/pAp phosphatase (c-di-AMP/oligoRNAs hydrolase)
VTPEARETSHRPLLIVLSDSAAIPARLRSRQRDVRRWLADPVDSGPDTFSGDPADPASYQWAQDAHGVTAVIDLHPPERARAALDALRSVRSDAAVLLLSDALEDRAGDRDGTLARGGELRDVLRLDLDEELQRLEAERRAYCLRTFAAGDDIVPILIHEDPDPDAISSAFAVATLLGASPERNPIVTLGPMTRPENRRMADLLHIRVTRVTRDELRRFERVITVDTQPRGLQLDGRPRLAVIDHHPAEQNYDAEFADIREDYGATATMLSEYLRAADERRISCTLATALVYGIRTDTDSLTRGVTSADVEAYAYLQSLADEQLVRRIERPSFAADTARSFGAALTHMDLDGDLCVACVGELAPDEAHVLADLADFCLSIENVTWVCAAALLDDELVLTLRHAGRGPGAGDVARGIAERGGSGGGHASMARVIVPRSRTSDVLGTGATGAGLPVAIRRLVRAVMEDVKSVASRPG